MATREMVTFKQAMSFPEEQGNVSHIVGIGGDNEKMDVMLIQALFRLVGNTESLAKRRFGVGLTDLPEPKGDFDNKTIQAIWGFQRGTANKLLNVDGKIHPGNYRNRVIDARGRFMTITLLNMLAKEEALMLNSDPDVISALTRIAPQLVLTRVAP